MTWNREEALRLINHGSPWVKYEARPAADAPSTSSLMRGMIDSLRSAVAEIDRRDRVDAGRERLTDTIYRLTAERDRLIGDVETVREVWRRDYERVRDYWSAAHQTAVEAGEALREQIAKLTAERDECRRTAVELGTHADAVADTRVNHEMSGLRADLARAQQRIMELEGRIARQEEWLRWPNHNMHEPVAKLYTEHFPNGGLRQTKDRFHAAIDKLTKERDEALADGVLSQRVCDIMNDRDQMQAERDAALARVKELEAELTAAWQATGVAGMVRGLTTLADVVGVHRAEIDTLRARIAVLEACIAAARAALTPDLIAALKAAGVEEP